MFGNFIYSNPTKLIFGEEIIDSFASGKIEILFLANDMSESSFERYNKKCTYYHIPYLYMEVNLYI